MGFFTVPHAPASGGTDRGSWSMIVSQMQLRLCQLPIKEVTAHACVNEQTACSFTLKMKAH
eukprot:1159111-Pelagomonas_calceolata.AAC.8